MTWVVSYFMGGTMKATRHQDGCHVLARAKSQHESLAYDHSHIQQLSVIEEDRYRRHLERGEVVEPRDHSCVGGEAVEQESLL
jgi:hypothetical protein